MIFFLKLVKLGIQLSDRVFAYHAQGPITESEKKKKECQVLKPIVPTAGQKGLK